MLTQYVFSLHNKDGVQPPASWGYRFYAELLRRAPPAFAETIHDNPSAPVPISQYLAGTRDAPLWHVSLLGEACEEAMLPVLEDIRQVYLEKGEYTFDLDICTVHRLETLDQLFEACQDATGLRFESPCAFKSRGAYVNFPTPWLLVQSLVKKWNGCVTECPIEDEDGQGVLALAEGLCIQDYKLHSTRHHLKAGLVPSFMGQLMLDNKLQGFHRQLAQALLCFAGYSGVGIKTALGMGGTETIYKMPY